MEGRCEVKRKVRIRLDFVVETKGEIPLYPDTALDFVEAGLRAIGVTEGEILPGMNVEIKRKDRATRCACMLSDRKVGAR